MSSVDDFFYQIGCYELSKYAFLYLEAVSREPQAYAYVHIEISNANNIHLINMFAYVVM